VVKEPEETWIVGLAAEAVGAISSSREVNIQSTWTREAAVDPLAVHFCSLQCNTWHGGSVSQGRAEFAKISENRELWPDLVSDKQPAL
jgi:hypothetical protein